jgi:hypothetical protein
LYASVAGCKKICQVIEIIDKLLTKHYIGAFETCLGPIFGLPFPGKSINGQEKQTK